MNIISPKRKIRKSYALPVDFDYYLPDIKGVFILLLLLLAGALIGNFVVLALTCIPGSEGLDSYSMLISYPVMFIPALVYASAKSRYNQGFDMEQPVSVDRNNFGKAGFPALAVSVIIATFAAGFIVDPVSKLLPPTPEWFDRMTEQIMVGTPLWATLLSVSVFAPVLEEWLCRGMILRGLLTRMKPGWAMVISSLFFALIHLNPWQALPAFLLGMLFAYVYYRTGSLKLTMLMHCVNNTFAVIAGQIDSLRDVDFMFQIMDRWQYISLLAASLVIIVLFVDIVWKNIPMKSPEGNIDVISVEDLAAPGDRKQ